ncbi:MAG: DUF2268 domain-containing putative Zn-dependent protease [Aquabacterium sp.]
MHAKLPDLSAIAVIALAALAAGCATNASPPAALVTTDAERLAVLLQRPALPSAAELQAAVLGPGTPGVRIFTPHRIKDAENLARAIAADPAAYRKAAAICLPAAQAIQAEAEALMARVARLLGETMPAPAYVLFGAGNSGGTAGPDGLALGLEVLCAGIDTPAAARAILMDFVAHEIAHVYQSRQPQAQGRPTLLHQALVEGFADYVMEQVRGPGQQGAAAERQRYGLAHEAALWRRFQADLARGAPFATWLYDQKPQAGGQPPDMGYWIGKRICEAYVARAADRAQALRTLLALRDAGQVLRDSGYAPM